MARKKSATMQDIAKLAGVSQPTVSLILNRRKHAFPPATVDRVLDAAKVLNYTRIAAAPTTAQMDRSILVLATTVTNRYYVDMVQSIEKSLLGTDYHVLVCNTYHVPAVEAAYLNMAVQQNFAGIILLYPPDSPEVFHTVCAQVPTVAICDRVTSMDSDIVELDNLQSGTIAASHILELGHKNIAFLSNSPHKNTGRSMRLQGIINKMKEYGLEKNLQVCILDDNPQDSLTYTDYNYRIGYALARDERIKQNHVTALICVNDMIALGAIDAMAEQGMSVPKDMSVMGFDNLLYTRLSRISLTTVDHHMQLVAQSAVELLLHRIQYPPSSSDDEAGVGIARFKFECAPTLVVRKSTSVPAAEKKRR